jgi:hypothetical protein
MCKGNLRGEEPFFTHSPSLGSSHRCAHSRYRNDHYRWTLQTPFFILNKYSDQQTHIKRIRVLLDTWNSFMFWDQDAIFRESKVQSYASTSTTILVLQNCNNFIIIIFEHFINVIPRLLCWYLQNFVLKILWIRGPGAEKVRIFYIWL